MSGTDEFKRRLGSTLDELISQRMADLPFAGRSVLIVVRGQEETWVVPFAT